MASCRQRFCSFFSPLSRIPSPMPAIRSCLDSIRNSRAASICASMTAVGLEQIAEFVCTQKMTNGTVDWSELTDTPSRIVWMCLVSLGLGYNLHLVVNAIRSDQENSYADETKIPAKKVLAGCTAYSTGLQFAYLSLNTPLTYGNAGYLVANTLLNGAFMGSLITGAGYFLQRLNYSIRPISLKHAKYVSAGIALSTVGELLDYMCTKMIKENALEWDSLVSPARLLGWHVISIAIVGTLYGVAAISFQKYSHTEQYNPEAIIQMRSKILKFIPGLASVGCFAGLAFSTPINLQNTPYIFAKTLVTGIPVGLLVGANTFVLARLFAFPEDNLPTYVEAPTDNTPLLRAPPRLSLLPPPVQVAVSQPQEQLSSQPTQGMSIQ